MTKTSVVRYVNAANGITSLSVAASVASILLAGQGLVREAILIGAVTLPCDVLDGAAARRWKTACEFGARLDSLSDAIAFGVLPAVLGYVLGVDGVAAVVLIGYVLSAVWRLALFDQVGLATDGAGREYFRGMPTTFAAALFYLAASASVWIPGEAGRGLLFLFFVTTPFLMSSGFAFPKRGWHTRPLWVLVPIALGALLLRK